MSQRIAIAVLVAVASAGVIARQQSSPSPCDPNSAGLTLPAGFCAKVVADGLSAPRHMTFSPRGDLYVVLRDRMAGRGEEASSGGLIVLHDADGNGVFEQQQRFGPTLTGTGIAWRDTFLYVGFDDRLVRYRMSEGSLVPTGQPELIVQFPMQMAHAAKPFAFGPNGEVYIHVGAPSNACQNPDRRAEVPGERPCPLLELHGGIWKYDANQPGQKHSASARFSTGMRHTTSLVWHNGALYGAQHGRDPLDTMWPKRFKAEQNRDLPAEELQRYREGANFGWPYCYYDPFENKRVQAPEYGGDGTLEGECAKFDKPLVAFPAHNAPLDLVFYTGTQFPAEYRNGAFVAFHGSWNRAPFPMDGYNIRFVPFKGDSPSGASSVFASGFMGPSPVMSPNAAQHRPAGLVLGRDGSLYVSDDQKGRIWKISYTGTGR
jgi:glucose/arabinose dehydrogenase